MEDMVKKLKKKKKIASAFSTVSAAKDEVASAKEDGSKKDLKSKAKSASEEEEKLAADTANIIYQGDYDYKKSEKENISDKVGTAITGAIKAKKKKKAKK